MKTSFDCVPCFIRQVIAVSRQLTDDAGLQERILRKALQTMAEMELRQPPPVVSGRIYRMVRDLSGNPDPYREVKENCNRIALGLYEGLKQRVAADPDPFAMAVRLAIAGNIIDFGVPGAFNEADLDHTIQHALTAPLDTGLIRQLEEAADQARHILYLGDNAGEIVFDRLLIELLPREKLTYVVRGGPIINDITMTDAEQAGMTRLVEVIDNGAEMPGTALEHCSESFRARFAGADLVIAKGQGNYETLEDVEKNIFFLLKVKCAIVSRHLQREVGSLILARRSA